MSSPLDDVSTHPWQRELVSPFLDELPISGISISVIGQSRRETTICVSDVLAGRIDDLQYSLGEGPHWESIRSGAPAIVTDVTADAQSQWPIFGQAVRELGVGALYSFPLTLGSSVVGVADMYGIEPGELHRHELDAAVRLAAAASATAVHRATQSAEHEPPRQSIAAELRREVQQATGMILVQLDITAAEALLRLKAHSYATGHSIDQIASDVVLRRLDFRDLE